MLLAQDPIVIDLKLPLKLKKGHYANIGYNNVLYFSIFYIKVKIITPIMFVSNNSV